MLGARRPSVTTSLQRLQQTGLIAVHRGGATITNRSGLEAVVCSCYRLTRCAYDRVTG